MPLSISLLGQLVFFAFRSVQSAVRWEELFSVYRSPRNDRLHCCYGSNNTVSEMRAPLFGKPVFGLHNLFSLLLTYAALSVRSVCYFLTTSSPSWSVPTTDDDCWLRPRVELGHNRDRRPRGETATDDDDGAACGFMGTHMIQGAPPLAGRLVLL